MVASVMGPGSEDSSSGASKGHSSSSADAVNLLQSKIALLETEAAEDEKWIGLFKIRKS